MSAFIFIIRAVRYQWARYERTCVTDYSHVKSNNIFSAPHIGDIARKKEKERERERERELRT